MKTIGLIGGMSWESSALYYGIINREIRDALGENHSSRCLLYSFDFQEIEELQHAGEWPALKERMYEAGRLLFNAGADFIVLCTNTMHMVMDSFEEETGIPLLHIVDVTGETVRGDGIATVGLLGTRFTMEGRFYVERIRARYGLEVLVPDEEGRRGVHDIIYRELVAGIGSDESRDYYLSVIDGLVERGAQGIILGCTEIGLLVKEHSCRLYDSTLIHARGAALRSLR
ncbi:MAG: aspartate/glutamate racemase family protein [Spirochaetes bacterium]|nr:aspartate/glutamate racemase family protein [Spirochaetota bacterium]